MAQIKAERLHDNIATLKTKLRELKRIEVQLNETPDKQISLTDPDARSMKTRGSGMVGYNVQAAVDAKHHLIVTHEVTNDGGDRDQLSAMAKQARGVMGVEELSAVADRGYFKGEEILACHEVGITVYVPKTLTSGATAADRFGKGDFIYDAAKNEYRCPAGESLIWRYSSVEKGLKLHRYWSSRCQGCALKEHCTPSRQRRVSRWEHEAVLEAMQSRLNQSARDDADPSPNGRAPVRHAEILDGCHPFPHQNARPGEYRDVPACARLQSQTRVALDG